MSDYTIWLCSPTGVRLAIIDQFVRLAYRRVVNQDSHDQSDTPPLTLLLRADALPPGLVERDSRLELWRTRSAPGSSAHSQELVTETVWLVRRLRKLLTADGQLLLELGAVPAIALLRDRIVAYPAGSAQASKNGPADDLMKQVVRENLGSAATDSSRSLSAWLGIAPDLGLAPVVRQEFARRSVLAVLRDLAAAADEAGMPLAFDLVCPTPGWLEFRTYCGARGSDHTYPNGSGPLVLAPDTGSLAQVEQTLDYQHEYTVVYAAGQGAESERLVVEASASDRLAASPFGRRELLHDARHTTIPAALTTAAWTRLAAGRPRRGFRAAVVNTPGMAYGQHWHWGDRITVAFAGEYIDCQIDELQVVVEHGQETVVAWLQADSPPPPTLSSQLERLAAGETETTYQQVQRSSLPTDSSLTLPAQGHLLLYGRYDVAGSLTLAAGARLVILA